MKLTFSFNGFKGLLIVRKKLIINLEENPGLRIKYPNLSTLLLEFTKLY